MVVASLGSIRNVEWLEGAGLAAGFWGVACDAGCRAFDINGVVTDNIFVAGDVARAPHVLYEYQFLAMEHWDNAVLGRRGRGAQHGEPRDRPPPASAAAAASGPASSASTSSPSACARSATRSSFTQGSVEDRRFAAAYGRNGRIVGAVTFNHGKWLEYYAGLIEQSAPFPPPPPGYDRAGELRADAGPSSRIRAAPTGIPDVVLTGHDPT